MLAFLSMSKTQREQTRISFIKRLMEYDELEDDGLNIAQQGRIARVARIFKPSS